MRKTILTGLILFTVQLINAQINALTEAEDEVILYEDGTWKYLNDCINENSEILVNDKEFLKDKKSTFLVKSKKLNVGIWINPKNWSFTKGTENDAFEFQFQKKDDDLYAMLISEKIQIPIENLKYIAIENAKREAPNFKVIKEEYRNVNGLQVFMMQMSGTIQGVRITGYGYYYSNDNGAIQLLIYTRENLFNDYLNDIEVFLNGLVENDSLTLYTYLGGKPDMTYIEAIKQVARMNGLKTEFFYGGCTGTFDHKEAEFKTKNRPAFKHLKYIYGANWLEQFNEEIIELRDRIAKKKN